VDRRVILITGASSGIGAATARHAAAAGWRVALVARSADRLTALAAEIGGPDRGVAIAGDVTDWESVRAATDDAERRFGRLDAVFANAGFGAVRGFLNESPEHWRDMILTNVYGAALTIRAAVPALERAGGHIVLTGSVAGHVTVPGSVYSATKHAAVAMAESARAELHARGIRVTAISPGNVDTPFFDNAPAVALTADDVARAVLFALEQPPEVGINEIVMRHRDQAI
jgi:NADP-dependent 3-hydroxy acid dehydrogenase YdfG